MESKFHVSFKVSDRSYLAILKKDIHLLAVGVGLSDKRVAELDIIVAELATNLVKHADSGIILAKPVTTNGAAGIELLGIDQGPGIADVNKMIVDGVSTKNTLGHGLGSIKRLADTFQMYSQKGWGTITLIRVFNQKPAQHRPPQFQVSNVILPKTGETECGDGFAYRKDSDYIKVFLGDGLGHGHDAAVAVQKAIDAFTICDEKDPVEIIRYINSAVKKTRGLVATVAVFDIANQKWRLCGVGNIATRIIGPEASKSHVSYNGIVGLNVPNTLNSLEIPYEKDQHVIMCSDGIRSRWDLIKYPAIFRYDLSILASLILKDYNRNTDDVSVAVCKINL